MFQSHQSRSLLQLIDRKQFDELCLKWEMDKGVRRFTTWEQCVTLVMAFLLELKTLREIEQVLFVPHSTLSDANRRRCCGFFKELCHVVLSELQAKSPRKVRRALRTLFAMDATSIVINARLESWGLKKAFKKKRSAAKLTTVWDIDGEWIEDFRISSGNDFDSPVAHQFWVKKGAVYIIDRGYQDLELWWKIMAARAHFVTRLKGWKRNEQSRNTLIADKANEIGVLWDGEFAPCRSKYRHPNVPENIRLRRVIYRDPETKRLFDFVTSDRRSNAQTIADLYKKRWAVELLYRWLKGHLNIRYLDTRHRNAIKTQLCVVILIRLLIQLKKVSEKSEQTAWQILRSIRALLTREGLATWAFANAYSPPFAPAKDLPR